MTGRVHPHQATQLVLRRLRTHGRDIRQDDRGGPTWVADCPCHPNRGGPVRIDQHPDGTTVVHPCRSLNGQSHTGAEIIGALSIDNPKVVPADRPEPLFSDPAKPRFKRTGPAEDSFAIFERLTAALVDGGYDDGRGRSGRFRCPACGARGDGHGLGITHQPNSGRKILIVCSSNRCPPEEILEPLGMTLAQICAGDDTDDLGEEDDDVGVETPSTSGEASVKVATDWHHDGQADLANARQLATTHGDRMRYVVPWKKWLCWDGTRWAPDDTGQAWRYAKQVADRLPKLGTKGGPGRAQTAPGIAAMLQLAGTEPGIAVSPDQLDADPYLLNVANGTLDLRTGQLRPHDPVDLLTKVAGASYDPNATAPGFTGFLTQIQPEESMRCFLRQLFGCALLGKVTEHILPIFYGVGANGKTTLVEAVCRTLGDYAKPVDPGLLIDRGDVHPTGVATLFGLRLAVTHELDAGRRLAEATVKRLTGGDRITARRMREDFWDFEPSHSLIMHTNHRPIVRGTDEGIWRRLRAVPFNVVIPKESQDSELPDRLALEAEGILTWCVVGYWDWRVNGLVDPEQVVSATTAFRGESDTLGQFLVERCRLDAGQFAHVQSSVLFAAWVSWCTRERAESGTQTAFSREMVDRGYEKRKDGIGNMVWVGIDLYADEADK